MLFEAILRRGRQALSRVNAPARPAKDKQPGLIYEGEAHRIAERTLAYPSLETGGDLFGYWTHSGAPVISLGIGPGVASRHNATSFYQDASFLHDVGTGLYDTHGLQHIGEWHSHHRLGLNEPSSGDVRTVQKGMHERGWQRFVLLIVTIPNESVREVRQNYFTFEGDGALPELLPLRSLPGASPLRPGWVEKGSEPHLPLPRAKWRCPTLHSTALQSVHEAYPERWFTREEEQLALRDVLTQLRDAGVEFRVFADHGADQIRVVLADGTIRLGHNFRRLGPSWDGAGAEPPSWTSSSNLADWYAAVTGRGHLDPVETRS